MNSHLSKNKTSWFVKVSHIVALEISVWQKVLNEGRGQETIILLVSQVLPSAAMSRALSHVTQHKVNQGASKLS